MTVEMDTGNISEEKVAKESQVADSVRFDWIVIALSTWLVLGGYSDAWAHNHVPSLETFFTPRNNIRCWYRQLFT